MIVVKTVIMFSMGLVERTSNTSAGVMFWVFFFMHLTAGARRLSQKGGSWSGSEFVSTRYQLPDSLPAAVAEFSSRTPSTPLRPRVMIAPSEVNVNESL